MFIISYDQYIQYVCINLDPNTNVIDKQRSYFRGNIREL